MAIDADYSAHEEVIVMSSIFWLRFGAIWGFLAISMGAFGAHGLQDRFQTIGGQSGGLSAERLQANFQTAAQYHMYCALALLAVGLMLAAGDGGHRSRWRAGPSCWAP